MDYTPSEETDPACLSGNGDINEVTAEVCRSDPFNNPWDLRNDVEAPCLFPYTINGQSFSTCITDEINDFTRPVFRCPIRHIKGIVTDYTDEHLVGNLRLQGEFCPTNTINASEPGPVVYIFNDDGPVYGPNGELELDPGNQNCSRYTLPVFATCKNNCPGGKI